MPVKVSRADIGPRPFTRRVGPDGSAHGGSAGPLSRDRVLRAAVALADDAGIESLTMRKLAMEWAWCRWRSTSMWPTRTNSAPVGTSRAVLGVPHGEKGRRGQ